MSLFKELIESWHARLEADKKLASEISCRIKIVATGLDGGTFIFDCRKPQAGVSLKEGDGVAEVTITSSVQDLIAVADKKLNPQIAFMQGKLTVSGDLGLALKASKLFAK